jgi:hypothetical protein
VVAWSYRRHRAVGFLVAFFFITLAPTSNLIILIGTVMAERFPYLPAVAFAAIVSIAGHALMRSLPMRARSAVRRTRRPNLRPQRGLGQ